MKAIERVAVLGAGVMGSGIAAHLANAGMRVLLLDVVPAEAAGGDRAARNRLAAAGVESALKSRAFHVPSYASNVEVGNLEDDLARLRECDWVIEAVLEDLEVKKRLFAEKVAPNLGDARHPLQQHERPLGGGDVEGPAAGRSAARFLVVHFFNPPRHMRLVEVVPCRRTSPAVLEGMIDLLRRRLGKGVVRGKDTPNFVANRIGVYSMCNGFRHMAELGMTVEEVDAVAGAATARPRSALFRLADLVGLDTLFHIAKHTRDLLPKDRDRDEFTVAPRWSGWSRRGSGGTRRRQGSTGRRRVPGRRGGDARLRPRDRGVRAAKAPTLRLGLGDEGDRRPRRADRRRPRGGRQGVRVHVAQPPRHAPLRVQADPGDRRRRGRGGRRDEVGLQLGAGAVRDARRDRRPGLRRAREARRRQGAARAREDRPVLRREGGEAAPPIALDEGRLARRPAPGRADRPRGGAPGRRPGRGDREGVDPRRWATASSASSSTPR